MRCWGRTLLDILPSQYICFKLLSFKTILYFTAEDSMSEFHELNPQNQKKRWEPKGRSLSQWILFLYLTERTIRHMTICYGFISFFVVGSVEAADPLGAQMIYQDQMGYYFGPVQRFFVTNQDVKKLTEKPLCGTIIYSLVGFKKYSYPG